MPLETLENVFHRCTTSIKYLWPRRLKFPPKKLASKEGRMPLHVKFNSKTDYKATETRCDRL